MKKIFYGFVGLPNTWVDDNDKQYSESFFKDKDYNDYTFDNFYDMDAMFGHENSLFGTRGLPVGHPDRSSRSFDMYNKIHGPMIVRVLNNNLKESIRRILREETYTSINVRRRIDRLKKLVDVVLSNSHPCDFSNEDHYLEGVIYDLETFLITYQMEGMTNEEIISFVRNYFYDNIKRYYIDSQEDC